jgi:NarL family two-component system response regulator LiaR
MKEGILAKKPIRVLIADDHPAFAQGLSRLLDDQPDLEAVGIAANGEEAVKLVRSLKPDVVVIDVSMPKLNGIKATRQIKNEFPETIVLVLSAYGYHPYVLSALEAGAGGYLLKNVPLRELLNAIRALPAGETVLDHTVAQKILRTLFRPLTSSPASALLTDREVKVLRLGAKGLSNREIAEKLFVSERTVQSALASVFQKLGVASRLEAVLQALKKGWLTMDDIP